MKEVFELQQIIEKIGQNDSMGLENICFAPMSHDGDERDVSQCTVQSVFGYFSNSIEKFERSVTIGGYIENYLNILDKCLE